MMFSTCPNCGSYHGCRCTWEDMCGAIQEQRRKENERRQRRRMDDIRKRINREEPQP